MIRSWDWTHPLPIGALAIQVGFKGGPNDLSRQSSSTPLLPSSGTGTR